jgi:hypothetical protein
MLRGASPQVPPPPLRANQKDGAPPSNWKEALTKLRVSASRR